MAKTQVLTYYIHLQDAALVARLNAQIETGVANAETGALMSFPTGGYGIYMAPVAATGTVDTPGGSPGATDGASNYFAALQGTYDASGPLPVVEVGEPRPAVGSPGYITSEWFVPGNGLPVQTRTFTKSSGWWIFGSSTKFYWMGVIIYDPPGTSFPPSDSAAEPIEQENLRVGFQTRYAMRGMEDYPSQTSTIDRTGRAFSRTGDGTAHRYAASGLQVRETIATSQMDPLPTTPRSVWCRFYVRPIRFGSIKFFRATVASSTNVGYDVGMDASGQYNFWLAVGSSAWSFHSSVGQGVLNEWAKFDLVLWCNHTGNVTHADLFLNGIKVVDDATNVPGGVEAARYWGSFELGTNDIVASTAIVDLDDCVIAIPPKTRDFATTAWVAGPHLLGEVVRYQGTKTYYCLQNTSELPGKEYPDGSGLYPYWRKLSDPIDFASGSHLVRAPASGFGPNHASWSAADMRLMWQRPMITTMESALSNTANAPFEIELDLADSVDMVPNTQGWVSFRAHCASFRSGAPQGTLGARIAAIVETMVTIPENLGSFLWNSRQFTIASSNVAPLTGTQVWLRYNKSNDALSSRIGSLFGTFECIGVFGTCDEPVQYDGTTQPQVFLPTNLVQTAEYPLSPYARNELPFAPIIVESGTYVGNNLGQDLSFALPPTFLYIRPVTGDSGGQRWWTGMLNAHYQTGVGDGAIGGFCGGKQNLNFVPGSPDTADQQQEYLIRICGPSTQINATGVTYQYVAFMDPAARFSRVQQVSLSTNSGLPRVEALDDPEFTPQHALILSELNGTTTTNGFYAKSAGSSADGISPTVASELANALTFGAGALTWRVGLVTDGFANYTALCFRRSDGNNSPNEPKAMFFGTYTGDGAASRTINLSPATGLRPLYLEVQGNTFYRRDPSDLTNSSRTNTGGALTTAITAGGIDSFTIGLTLNTNAVVYHYWGLWGGSTAGNGGFSVNGEFVQVESDSRFPSDWVEPVVVDIVVPPEPGVVLTDEPDLEEDTELLDDTFNVGGLLGGQACEVYTRRLVNRALGRIGITKVIANLATDQTEYATAARQHVKEDINAVLRDHPWAFATRYADLVLSSGSAAAPFSNDWTYAYLAPNSMMFARRISTQPPGRSYGYAPVVFRHYMHVTLGPLILCNAEATTAVPLVLEYTIRHTCPAFYGDAIFRDALVWRFAKSLASSLARDSAKAQYCEGMYRDVLARASTVVEREQQQDKHGDADWIDARG